MSGSQPLVEQYHKDGWWPAQRMVQSTAGSTIVTVRAVEKVLADNAIVALETECEAWENATNNLAKKLSEAEGALRAKEQEYLMVIGSISQWVDHLPRGLGAAIKGGQELASPDTEVGA